MKTLLACWEFFGKVWCRMAHQQIMWPAHGFYECSECGRRYAVAWEAPRTLHPARATAAASALREADQQAPVAA